MPPAGEIEELAHRLSSSRSLSELTDVMCLLVERLSTARFIPLLNAVSSSANGWSTIFKACVVGLHRVNGSDSPHLVSGLGTLVERAHECGARFSADVVEKTAVLVETQVNTKQIVVEQFWNILLRFSAQGEYFREMGHDRALRLAQQHVSLCWAALLPTSEHGMSTKLGLAARLLGQLLVSFPYSLPWQTTGGLLEKMVAFLGRCKCSCSGQGPRKGQGMPLAHCVCFGVKERHAILPELWAGVNALLRRQAASDLEAVWHRFVDSPSLQGWLASALPVSDRLLGFELLQFCRLLLRLSNLNGRPPPRLVLIGALALLRREVGVVEGGQAVMLRPSGVAPSRLAHEVLYRHRTQPPRKDLRPASCTLDLAADLTLVDNAILGLGRTSEVHREESGFLHASKKTPRAGHSRGACELLAPWLSTFSCLWVKGSSASAKAERSARLVRATCDTSRRALVLCRTLQKIPRVPPAAAAMVLRILLPEAVHPVEEEQRGAQLYALLSLLALAAGALARPMKPVSPSASRLFATPAWRLAWDRLARVEFAVGAQSVETTSNATLTHISEIRAQLLCSILAAIPTLASECRVPKPQLSRLPAARQQLVAALASTGAFSPAIPPQMLEVGSVLLESTPPPEPGSLSFSVFRESANLDFGDTRIDAAALWLEMRTGAILASAGAAHGSSAFKTSAVWSVLVDGNAGTEDGGMQDIDDVIRHIAHLPIVGGSDPSSRRRQRPSPAGGETLSLVARAALAGGCTLLASAMESERHASLRSLMQRSCLAAWLLRLGDTPPGSAGSVAASPEMTLLKAMERSWSSLFDQLDDTMDPSSLALVHVWLEALHTSALALNARSHTGTGCHSEPCARDSDGAEATMNGCDTRAGFETHASRLGKRCQLLLHDIAARVLERITRCARMRAGEPAALVFGHGHRHTEEDFSSGAQQRAERALACWLPAFTVLCDAEREGSAVPASATLQKVLETLNHTVEPGLRVQVCAVAAVHPGAGVFGSALLHLAGLLREVEHDSEMHTMCLKVASRVLLATRDLGRSLAEKCYTNAQARDGCATLMKHAVSRLHRGAAYSEALAFVDAATEFLFLATVCSRAGVAPVDEQIRKEVARGIVHLLYDERRQRHGDVLRLHPQLATRFTPLLACFPSEQLLLELEPAMDVEVLDASLESNLSAVLCLSMCLAAPGMSPAALSRVLRLLYVSAPRLALHERVLLPAVWKRTSSQGRLASVLRIQLCDLIEWWVDGSPARALSELPCRWHQQPPVPTGPSALQGFLREHRHLVIPTMVVATLRSANGRVDGDSLLQRVATKLDCCTTDLVSGALPQLIGAWLLEPEGPHPHGQIGRAVEEHLRACFPEAQPPASTRAWENDLRSHIPNVLQACSERVDAVLLGVLSCATLASLGHQPSTLVTALNRLQTNCSPESKRLLYATPGRVIDLVQLLHFGHSTPHKHGVDCLVRRTSTLLALEALLHPGALLPLALPPHEGQYAPLVALARHLQQALLHLLASTTQHRSSTGAYFARCCAVLRVLFDAIMETTPAHYDNRTHVRDAFIRSHTLALVSALVDFANTRITTEASFVLLKHVVVRTPAEERTRLGMLLRERELPELVALCAERDSPKSLELMLRTFATLPQKETVGLALVSRLQDLIHHLHDDQVRRQLNAALLHSFGTELCANEEPSADESAAKLVAAATAAARRLLLICRAADSGKSRLLLGQSMCALLACGLSVRTLSSHDASSRSFTARAPPSGPAPSDLSGVLVLLHGFLADPDGRTVLLTVEALKHILSKRPRSGTDLGNALAVLKEAHPIVCSELDAYRSWPTVGSRGDNPGSTLRAAARDALQTAIGEMDAAVPAAVTSPDLWCIEGKRVDRWVCSLTQSLLRHCGRKPELLQCRSLASRSYELARACLLPSLFTLLEEDARDSFCVALAEGLTSCFDTATAAMQPCPDLRHHADFMLSVLVQLRAHASHNLHPRDQARAVSGSHSSSRRWEVRLFRTLDLRRVALAARAAGSPLSALQLLEAWAEEQGVLKPEALLHVAGRAQQLLDLLPDVVESDFATSIHSGAVSRLRQEQEMGALPLLDRQLALQARPGSAAATALRLVHALHNGGCEQLSAMMLQRFTSTRAEPAVLDCHAAASPLASLREEQAEAAWRLGNWQPLPPSFGTTGFHQRLHSGLALLHQGRPDAAAARFEACTKGLVAQLGENASDETWASTHWIGTQLRMCTDALAVAHGLSGSREQPTLLTLCTCPLDVQLQHRRTLDDSAGGTHALLEPVLALHATLCSLTSQNQSLVAVLLHAISAARDAGCLAAAAASLYQLRELALDDTIRLLAEWEHAQLLWRQSMAGDPGAHEAALSSAATVREAQIPTRADAEDLKLMWRRRVIAQACRESALWLEAGSSVDGAVVQDLFERALQHSTALPSTAWARSELCETHHAYASWLEAQHRSAAVQVTGTQRRAQLSAAAAQQRSALQLRLAALVLQQHAASARYGGRHDHAALFAIVRLWFRYPHRLNEAEVELCALPTRKLLPLINQLASRLNKGAAADRFQHGLRHILRYAGAAHVHTVLPHLLALANGDRFALHEARVGLGAEKILGARELLATLSSDDSKAARVIEATSFLFDFYLQVAWVPPPEVRKLEAARVKAKRSGIDITELLKKVKARTGRFEMQKGTALYDMVKNGRAAKAAVLTQRSDQVLVRGVQPSIQTAGGVNLPKIIKCEGSDGCVYKQLVKGKDDTRQDAVMQQAFELVNVLLHKVNSRQRALRLRTYRVVPLAQTAGVLQWVEDTIPLTQYLVGATRTLLGAHGRFRPSDMTTQAARAKMKEVQERQPLVKAAQLAAYAHITDRLKPVHFRACGGNGGWGGHG